jgi:hypothetical protein
MGIEDSQLNYILNMCSNYAFPEEAEEKLVNAQPKAQAEKHQVTMSI